jgi:outer membrane receptor protein involved in Fe transport
MNLPWLAIRFPSSAAGLFGLILAASSAAQEPDPSDLGKLSLEDLLRVQVKSTTTGATSSESDLAPANVITITRDDIVRHNWQSVGEVLEHVPGLYVTDDLVLRSVSVRGVTGGLRSGSRIIKVMINGIEVTFRPDLSAFLGPEYIPIEAVRQVEIARGPLSALFGANAFLATVNVVTREPPEKTRAELSARGGVRPQSGRAFGSGGASALLLTAENSISVLAAARIDAIDRSGLHLQNTFEHQLSLPVEPNFTTLSQNDLSLPIGLYGQAVATSSTRGTVTLQGGMQRLHSGGEFITNSLFSHSTVYSLTNYWVNVSHQREWKPWFTSTLSLGYSTGGPNRDEKLFTSNLAGVTNPGAQYTRNFSYRSGDLKATALFTIKPQLQFLVGLDGSLEHYRTLFYTQTFLEQQGQTAAGTKVDLIGPNDAAQVLWTTIAPSFQIMSDPISDLRLVGNARLDFSNVFAMQWSWRAAAAYRITDQVVAKLIAGRSFQSPSNVLMFALPGYGTANNVVGNRTQPGQPTLGPQTVNSLEAVVSALPTQNFSIVGSLFLQEVRNRIEFSTLGLSYIARNRGVERVFGAELNARASIGRFAPQLSATSQWTLPLEGVVTTAPANYPTFWTLAGVDVDLLEIWLKLNATLRIVGARGSSQSNTFLNGQQYTLPPYAHLDFTAITDDLNLFGAGHETRLSFAFRNILDMRRSEPGFGGIDVPVLGRTLSLELNQAF